MVGHFDADDWLIDILKTGMIDVYANPSTVWCAYGLWNFKINKYKLKHAYAYPTHATARAKKKAIHVLIN